MLSWFLWSFGRVSHPQSDRGLSDSGVPSFLTGSFTLIIPYHIILRLLTNDYTACGMNEHENLFVCLFPFCSYYAVPLIVIIVCYTKLALHVIRAGRTMAGHMDTVGGRSFFFRRSFSPFLRLCFLEKFPSDHPNQTPACHSYGKTECDFLATLLDTCRSQHRLQIKSSRLIRKYQTIAGRRRLDKTEQRRNS